MSISVNLYESLSVCVNLCKSYNLSMGVRNIFRSRQLSSQSFSQKSCQGNCQVNCATKKILQGNCQVNSFSKNFFKAIVKSIVLPKNSSRQLSSQLFGENLFNFCMSIFVIFRLILVNYGKFCSIMVNYRSFYLI